MQKIIQTVNGCVKHVTLECSPAECLIIDRAIKDLGENQDAHPDDRKQAERLIKSETIYIDEWVSKCKNCIHFQKLSDGRKGSVRGICELNPKDALGIKIRMGYSKSCKNFESEGNDR